MPEVEAVSGRRAGSETAENAPDCGPVASLRVSLISFGFSPEIVLPKWPSPNRNASRRWRASRTRFKSTCASAIRRARWSVIRRERIPGERIGKKPRRRIRCIRCIRRGGVAKPANPARQRLDLGGAPASGTPDTLVFVTGGFAVQNVTLSATCAGGGALAFCLTPQNESHTKVMPGWTVGGRIERRIWANWLARVEYRYPDFGTFDRQFFPPCVLPGGICDQQFTGHAS
jgi:opacity protein-like surface antigen